jgi:hypothetical protein
MLKYIIILILLITITKSENMCKHNTQDECFDNPPYPGGPWQNYQYHSIDVNKNILCVSFRTLFGSTGKQCLKFNCNQHICHNGNFGYDAIIYICSDS